MIDTHCHLYWENLENKIDEIVKNWKKAWVKKFLNIWCDNETTKKAFEQSKKFEEIFFTSWVHPVDCHSKKINFEELEDFAKNKKCLAIWECWFDFYHKPFDEKEQKNILLKQIKLAEKYKKPLVIHTRNAWEKVLDFLEENFEWKFVIHCFSEDKNFAKRLLKMWWILSIWGILTYPQAKELREIIKDFPLEKIMLETDSPFLAPQSNRGKINEPAFVKEVAVKISEIKWIWIEEVIFQTTKNAEDFFGI